MEEGAAGGGLLDGRVAIVTGAGQGMGRGIALAMAAEGARVVLAGRTLHKLQAVEAEVETRGSKSLSYVVDVTQRASVVDLAAAVEAAWGRIDILVNAAYDAASRPLRSTDR